MDVQEDKIAEVSDILEQIAELNKIIEFHHQNGNSGSLMVEQYEFLKNDFLQKLSIILKEFKIEAELHNLAA